MPILLKGRLVASFFKVQRDMSVVFSVIRYLQTGVPFTVVGAFKPFTYLLTIRFEPTNFTALFSLAKLAVGQ